jgi:glycosyltransferase involved in cell wall biosynthesis
MRTRFRQWFGPFTLLRAARTLKNVLKETQPELVHALRIPFEGMLTALANPQAPLVVSVWGNDFTLHARTTPLMTHYTRKAVRRADALITDCQRDLRLARQWGFPEERFSIVLPGAGGIQLDIFYPPEQPVSEPVVINPRGLRAYVRNDTFFKAIPLVLARRPETRFLCPAMQGEPQADKWASDLGIRDLVELLPHQNRQGMAEFFRQAMVVVSPSEHDGTPNSLLEGMACGCFPVAGDIESIRELITHGENGLLTDPGDPHALAQAILTALDDSELRDQAHSHNSRLIKERAEYGAVMKKAEEFYKTVIDNQV